MNILASVDFPFLQLDNLWHCVGEALYSSHGASSQQIDGSCQPLPTAERVNREGKFITHLTKSKHFKIISFVYLFLCYILKCHATPDLFLVRSMTTAVTAVWLHWSILFFRGFAATRENGFVSINHHLNENNNNDQPF